MIVTKDRVKIELGVTDTSLDIKITETIPKAEARYRTIANFNFNTQFITTYVTGTNHFTLSSCPDSLIFDLNYGDLIEGTGVPAEAYITTIDKINGLVYVSEDFTDGGDSLSLAQNISYWPVISSVVYYLIGKQSITNQNKKEVLSKAVSPLRVSFDKSSINQRYGLPENLVQSIPSYGALM
jgi:hypothetical protein